MSIRTIKQLPHRQVIHLAWPMILSNITTPLLGLVDTAILGHLDSPAHLGAAAIGASILSFVFWGFAFLRMGTTSLTARAFGQQDQNELGKLLVQAASLAVLLALLLLATHTSIINLALMLIQPPQEVTALAASYSQIRFYAAPAMLLNLTLMGWFIGMQNTRAPLLILITVNAVNIILDAWFILGLNMGSDGAALASAIAEYSGTAVALLLLLRGQHKELLWPLQKRWLTDQRGYLSLLKVNSHLFLRTACLLLTFAFFNAQSAQFGVDTLAANAILFQLLLLVAYGLDGFAHAAEALIGKAVGAKDPQEFTSFLLTTGLWSAALTVVMTFIFAAAKPLIISLFTDIASVTEQLNAIYPWILLLPLTSVWAYWLDGIYIGAGQTRRMLVSMLISCGGVFFPLWWLSQGWGNHGLWLAFTALNLTRGLTLALSLKHIGPTVVQATSAKATSVI